MRSRLCAAARPASPGSWNGSAPPCCRYCRYWAHGFVDPGRGVPQRREIHPETLGPGLGLNRGVK
jgi:hypothetical protein